MSRSRFLLVPAGAAVAGLILAGCSSAPSAPTASTTVPSIQPTPSPTAPTTGGDVSASPAAYLQQAAQATKDSGTAKFTGQVDSGSGGGPSVQVGMKGQIDFATGAVQADVTSGMLGSQTIQVIVVDKQSYIKMPMFQGKWLKSPAQDVGVKVTDPTEGLGTVKDLADLQEVGTENVDGIDTTHWSGTLDVKEALAQADLSADQQAKIEKGLDHVKKGATVDVWVDDEGRIVQIKTTMDLDTGNSQPMAFTSTVKFSDFGSPVDIQAPNPNDVISASDLGTNLEDLAPQGE